MSPAGRGHLARRTLLVVAGCLVVGALAVVAASRLASQEEAPAGNFSPVVVPSPDEPAAATPSPSPATPSPSRSTPGSRPGPVQATPSPRTVEDDDDDDDDQDDDDDRDDD